MLKNVEKEYYTFLQTYLLNTSVNLSKEVSKDNSRPFYDYVRTTWSLNDKVILEENVIEPGYASRFPRNTYWVEEEYLTDFFISLFEEEGTTSSIKSYFVCYYDNETKQLGNDVVKIYNGIRDKDSLNRMISKLKGKVVLNYKEI